MQLLRQSQQWEQQQRQQRSQEQRQQLERESQESRRWDSEGQKEQFRQQQRQTGGSKSTGGSNFPSPGLVFTACGKEWQVWNRNVDWNQTQSWIKGLGGGWRTPKKSELRELYNEIGKAQCVVWAESRLSETAWFFYFYDGDELWRYRTVHDSVLWGMAVRSR